MKTLKDKYAPNKSYESSSQTDSDLRKIEEQESRVKKLNINLNEVKKRVEAAAAAV